ncbi:interleukin-17F-like [Hyperolius riggenbachi]|uniref:interleukin-17F-like n=1 Tax=Hyperolius riggenbachi TaxID=752182 RepID=UPI0035A2BB5A
MRHLRKGLLLQVLILVTLLLLTHQENSKATKKNGKREKRCKEYLSVRLKNKPSNLPSNTSGIRNFQERSIVHFVYHNIYNTGGIPEVITEYKCNETCRGHEHEWNAVPIKRNIFYLKKERRENKTIYVLDEMTVTVGCTCVTPEYKVQESNIRP